MKIKHAVIFLLLGILTALVGALFKIEHWAGADVLLLSSIALTVAGFVLLAVKLLTRPDAKRFLNS
ncbi:hypothetical protein BEN47_14615 [Hymenobacter lapidarius]|uniref:Gliding motility protein GldL-like N-terminal domain-containing protein n=1 Tax=Hymenobacter lapidarius TaxID=1908237 RepID=A0A1G1T4C4_9BACT|nr:hypothetical protein [Hymenobacter lapidarius]OGX85718.1 hypothetical protein BEN47_14615 [Hymenobacter lapidarius]